jgi:hypothetical protein
VALIIIIVVVFSVTIHFNFFFCSFYYFVYVFFFKIVNNIFANNLLSNLCVYRELVDFGTQIYHHVLLVDPNYNQFEVLVKKIDKIKFTNG